MQLIRCLSVHHLDFFRFRTSTLYFKMKPVWFDEHSVVGGRVDNIIAGHGIGNASPNANPEGRHRSYKMHISETAHQWAQLSEAKSSAEDEDELVAAQQMKASAVIFAKGPNALHSKHLKSKLLRDVTIGHQQGSVSAVKFHPNKPVLVTATTSGTLSLFELCNENANLELKSQDFFLQSVHFPRFRLDNFEFFDGGTSLLASSANQNHLYTYDLLNGKVALVRQPVVLDSLRTRMTRLSSDGSLIGLLANSSDLFVFDFKTMEHLHTFRGGENVVDFCFAPFDRNILYSLSVGGAVNTFNLSKRSEQEIFFDHGCVRATCFSCSRTGQFIACGSNTGIVNVYDITNSKSPTAVHTLDQLTTSISFVHFNSDAQIMAFGSSVKRMAGRLANCSSGSVFQNFPARQEHFAGDHFTSCEFSPNSAFFSFGTKQGKLRLYRLSHSDRY